MTLNIVDSTRAELFTYHFPQLSRDPVKMADTTTSTGFRQVLCVFCEKRKRHINICGRKGREVRVKVNLLVHNEFDKFLEKNSNIDFGFCRGCVVKLNKACEFVQQIRHNLGLEDIRQSLCSGLPNVNTKIDNPRKEYPRKHLKNTCTQGLYLKVANRKGYTKETIPKVETVHVVRKHHLGIEREHCEQDTDENEELESENETADICEEDSNKKSVLFAIGLKKKSKKGKDPEKEESIPNSIIEPLSDIKIQSFKSKIDNKTKPAHMTVSAHDAKDRDVSKTVDSEDTQADVLNASCNKTAIAAEKESSGGSSKAVVLQDTNPNQQSIELYDDRGKQKVIKIEPGNTSHEIESDIQLKFQSLSNINSNPPSVISKTESCDSLDGLEKNKSQNNAEACADVTLGVHNSNFNSLSMTEAVDADQNKINMKSSEVPHEKLSTETNQQSSGSNNDSTSTLTEPVEQVESLDLNQQDVSKSLTGESKQNQKIVPKPNLRRGVTVDFLKRNMFTEVKRTPETEEIAEIVMSNEVMLKAVERKILWTVNDTCVKLTYRGKPDSSILDRYRTMDMLLQHCDDLLDEIVTELADNLPFLLDIMCTIVTGGRTPRECDVAPIAAAYAILMHARSERLSAWHRLICLITMKGRMSERALSRLGQFGVGTSAGTRERLNKELAQHKDTPLVLQLTTAGVISNFLAPVCQGKIEFKKPMSQWKKDYLKKKKQDRIEAAKKREKEKERKKAEVAQRKAKRSSVVKLRLKNMPAMVDSIPASGGVPNKYEAGPLIQLPGAEKKKATPKTIIVSKQGAFVRVVNTNSAAFRSDVSSDIYKDITSSSKAVGTSPSSAVSTATYKDIDTVPCTAVSTASITAVGTASSKAVGTASSKAVGTKSSTTLEAASMRDVSTSTGVGTTTSATNIKSSEIAILDMTRKRPALGVRGTNTKTVKKKKITWAGVEIPEDAETLQEVIVYPPVIYAKDSSSLVAEESFPVNITGIASNADGVIAQQGAQQVSTLCSTTSQEFSQSGYTAQPMHLSLASGPHTSVLEGMQANMTNSTLADCSLQQAGISGGMYAQTSPIMPNNTVYNVNTNFNFPQTSGGIQRMDACRYAQSSGKQSSFGQQKVAEESCSNPEYEIITSIMAVGESLQVEKYPSVPSVVQPGSQNMDQLTHHTVIPQHTVEYSQTNAKYGYSNQTR